MRIGTRGSKLALTQAGLVAELLGAEEVVRIKTSGDGDPPVQPSAADKSRWVDGLERALATGEIDLAVHSAKDLPGELADGLALLGAPVRAAVEDVLCGAESLEELPAGARVGTGSVRRAAQLLAAREDLTVLALGGNVDTRLGKLGEEQRGLHAIVLARAGLVRLGREDEVSGVLDPERFVPSPGQGALALEGRADDTVTRAAVEAITDTAALECLLAERALARALGASCHTPLGAWARTVGDGLELRAWVGLPDGSAWVGDVLEGERGDPEGLGQRVARRMTAVGAGKLLEDAEEMALERA
ncbi:MAG TPA: hydroxymethylbilane synthase [Solirubrobacteraceae bacterium]|jgi:hydroxymethylbilane synthase